LNPAIAVSSAFSFAGNPLPVPLTEICTENASAAMAGAPVPEIVLKANGDAIVNDDGKLKLREN